MSSIQFKGKPSVETFHLTVPYRRLVPLAEQSRTTKLSLDDNIIVHGDNLLALKALLPTFTGKVKCIYIDPPYNTGNEGWAYNDNVNSAMHQEWLGDVVDRDDLTRHDKWLCMIWPRLKLLRELLSDDDAIFVSIDDNEAHRLRMVMDEIFEEQNFVAQVVWQRNYAPKNTAQFFSDDHDYVVVYAKDVAVFKLNLMPRTEEQDAAYQNPDNDPRGPWKSSDLSARNFYSLGTYPITTPSGRVIASPLRVHIGEFLKANSKNL
jgi:adenine-specific DNA-methyltransferase